MLGMQWMQITNTANGKSVYAKTRDECEGCGQDDIGMQALSCGSHVELIGLYACPIDLSPSAFSSIGNLNTGVLKVQWHFMAKGWSP